MQDSGLTMIIGLEIHIERTHWEGYQIFCIKVFSLKSYLPFGDRLPVILYVNGIAFKIILYLENLVLNQSLVK